MVFLLIRRTYANHSVVSHHLSAVRTLTPTCGWIFEYIQFFYSYETDSILLRFLCDFSSLARSFASLHIDWSSRELSKKKSISQSPYWFIIYADQGDNPWRDTWNEGSNKQKKSGDEWPVGDEIDTFSIQLINLSYFFCSPRDSPDHTLLILLFIRKSRVCLFINVNWIEKTDRKNGFFVSPPGTEWVLTQALGFC